LKFPSGNQLAWDSTIISNSDADKRAILQHSKENSRKLLLLASALENVKTSKKMSECGVLLNDYEVHCFEDPNGVPNKALFHLLLTYVDMHFKMIL
jgi:hypothetical protein